MGKAPGARVSGKTFLPTADFHMQTYDLWCRTQDPKEHLFSFPVTAFPLSLPCSSVLISQIYLPGGADEVHVIHFSPFVIVKLLFFYLSLATLVLISPELISMNNGLIFANSLPLTNRAISSIIKGRLYTSVLGIRFTESLAVTLHTF